MTTSDALTQQAIEAAAHAAAKNYDAANALLIHQGQVRDPWLLAQHQVAASLAVADEIRALRFTLELKGDAR